MENAILSEKTDVGNSYVQFVARDVALKMFGRWPLYKMICAGPWRVELVGFMLGLLLALPCRADSISSLGGEYVSQVETFVSGGVVNSVGSEILKNSQSHTIYLTTDNSDSWLDQEATFLSLNFEVPSWIEDYEVNVDYILTLGMAGQAQRNLGCVFDKHYAGDPNRAPFVLFDRTTIAPITCTGKFRVRRNYGEKSRLFSVTVLDTYHVASEPITKYHRISKTFVITQLGYGFKVDCERLGGDYIVTGMHTGEGNDIDDDAVLTIPNGVTKIGESSFTKCEFPAIKVVLPRQLETIGSRAFSGCVSLTAVDFTDSGKNRLSIGDYAFEGCTGLTSVYFPACVASVGKGAFANCTNLKEFKVDTMNSLTLSVRNGLLCDVLGRKILACPPALTSVTIPASITGIATDAFKGCTQLKSVSVPSGNLDQIVRLMRNSGFEINGVKFNGEEYFDDGGHSAKVGDYTWYFFVTNGVSIINPPTEFRPAIEPAPNGKIIIPSVLGGHPVVSISGYAMQKNSGDEASWHLTEVEFPKSISHIGQYAFAFCDELSKITIPDGVSNLAIGDGAFSGCALTNVELPEGVMSIGRETFSCCRELTSIVIPSSVMSIDPRAFYGCGELTSVNVNSANERYCSIDGVLYDKDVAELICCPNGVKSVIVPSSATSIGDWAFSGCSLTSVKIPSSVTSIGADAFYGCSGLRSVYVDRGDANRVKDLMRDKSIDIDTLTFIEPCVITFNANGGSCDISSRQVAYQDAIGELPIPIRGGCIFAGWFTEKDVGEEITPETIIESDVTYYAHWTLIDYSISYLNLRGMANPNPPTYTILDAITFLPLAEKSGLRFVGWDKPSIALGSIGDITVTASWEECELQDIVDIPEDSISFGGDADWLLVYVDGKWTMRSGKIAKSQSSYCDIKFTGPAKVSFSLKVSCEAQSGEDMTDGMELLVDGESVLYISGITNWEDKYIDVLGEGEHTVRWCYSKDNKTDKGDDCCYLSDLVVTPIYNIAFTDGGADGGEAPVALNVWKDGEYALPDCGMLHKAKYAFVGWKLGEVVYPVGATLTATESVEFTAVWEAKVLPTPIVEVAEYYTTEKTTVTIDYGVDGVTGYYRIDGGDPIVYDEPFEIEGTHTIVAYAIHEDYFDSAVTKEYGSVRAPWTIGECLNYDGVFGDTTWVRDLEATHDGKAAMRSGITGNKESSRLLLSVSGSGMLAFWCKTSSEYDADDGTVYDGMVVYIDGVAQNSGLIGGDTDWTRYDIEVVGEGAHTIVWSYEKDKGGSDGEDCVWIDEVKWERKTTGGAVIGDVTALKEAFGEESSVVRNLTSEEELTKFNEFLGKCGITAASQISERQKQYAYESFRMSEITVEPQLFEDEPKLKIDEFKQSEGGWSVSISLKAGGEEIAMVRKALEERIRVGSKLTEITAKPNIVARPSEDGSSLTFTIAPIEDKQAFIMVRL